MQKLHSKNLSGGLLKVDYVANDGWRHLQIIKLTHRFKFHLRNYFVVALQHDMILHKTINAFRNNPKFAPQMRINIIDV